MLWVLHLSGRLRKGSTIGRATASILQGSLRLWAVECLVPEVSGGWFLTVVSELYKI